MRKITLVLLTLVFGCGPAVANFTMPMPRPVSETETCILRQLTQAGYAILDRDEGFVRAEKPDALMSLGTEITVVSDAGSGLQVSVRRVRLDSTNRYGAMRTRPQDREQAEALLAPCTREHQ